MEAKIWKQANERVNKIEQLKLLLADYENKMLENESMHNMLEVYEWEKAYKKSKVVESMIRKHIKELAKFMGWEVNKKLGNYELKEAYQMLLRRFEAIKRILHEDDKDYWMRKYVTPITEE